MDVGAEMLHLNWKVELDLVLAAGELEFVLVVGLHQLVRDLLKKLGGLVPLE